MPRLSKTDGVKKSSKAYTANHPDLIQVVKGFNARKKFDVKDLMDSIKEKGVMAPLWVRRDAANEEQPFILIAGERRLRALQKIYEEDPKAEILIPLQVFNVDEDEAEDMMAIENLEREDLTLSERVGLVARYLSYELSTKDIADRLNRSIPWVSQMAALQGASKKVKQAADKGVISTQAAVEIAKRAKVKDQEKALERVVALAKGEKRKTAKAAKKLLGAPVRPSKKELLKVIEKLEAPETEEAEVDVEVARNLILDALRYAAEGGNAAEFLNACAESLSMIAPEEEDEQEAAGEETEDLDTQESEAPEEDEQEAAGEGDENDPSSNADGTVAALLALGDEDPEDD